MTFYSQNGLYVLFLLLVVFLIRGRVKDLSKYFTDDMHKKIFIGKNQKKIKLAFLILSFICLVFALARPVVKKEPIKIKQPSVTLIVAFDISKSMLAKDLYPNRLTFAKNKFPYLLNLLKNEKVGVIGFSSKAFLVSPITSDYATAKYLVKNMKLGYVNTKGTSLLEALKGVEIISEKEEKKAVIFFTDGSDNENFSEEIAFAKEHKIKVFVYGIGTEKGSVIEDGGELLEDSNQNIVITKLNENIKELTAKTDGAYLDSSNANDDLKPFVDDIRAKFEAKNKEEVTINQNEELFYIPLMAGMLFFALGIFGLGRR
ncbi:MAG: vWA domain-containing protein [Arcobacteraceae bacterium]